MQHKPVPLRPPLELSLEQIELDAPLRLVIRQEDETSVFDVEYRLDPVPGGTRFTQVSDFTWKKLPRFLQGTFERGVRRDLRKQLECLCQLLFLTDPQTEMPLRTKSGLGKTCD